MTRSYDIEQQERILSLHEVRHLGALVEAVRSGVVVSWLTPHNDVLIGTLRSIGDEVGNYIGPGEDVRDAFVRITTTGGFEHFMPVAKAVELLARGEMRLG